MSDCIDKKLGRLLHDYELGLLSDEDSRRFEMHLYECDYCLEQVREFMDVSKFIAADRDSKAIIEEAASETGPGENKKKSAPFIRLLIAAAIALVIIIPVYKFVLYDKPVSITQTLELLPTRTGGNDVIYLEKGGNVDIGFYVNPWFKGQADILISDVAGDTTFYKHDFDNINDEGFGRLILPISSFSQGHYIFILRPTNDSTPVREVQYMFRVKNHVSQ